MWNVDLIHMFLQIYTHHLFAIFVLICFKMEGYILSEMEQKGVWCAIISNISECEGNIRSGTNNCFSSYSLFA
jgi:hypothetical protein